MEEQVKKVIPIKSELRPLIEEFINYPEYQTIFRAFAKHQGYEGDDIKRVREHLFIPDGDGEIMFNVEGMYDLFTEFQMLKELTNKEPYKTLLEHYPVAIQNIRIVAKKIFNEEVIDESDLVSIFNTDQYEQKEQGEKV